MRDKTDLTGQRFGRLTVLERAGSRSGNSVWLCKCDCGVEKSILRSHLISGSTKSCGCLAKQSVGERSKTHGIKSLIRHGVNTTETALYKVWQSLRNRCNNPKNPTYKWYGACGVTVCTEWEDPEAFIQWSKSHGYETGKQIDRIDSRKGYSPDNCRYISSKGNIRNRRTTFKVGTYSFADICEGLSICTIKSDKLKYYRLYHFIKSHGSLSQAVRGC